MSQAVLWENNSAQAVAAPEGGEGLRLSAAELEAVTGWTSKPEGLCRADACVPAPRGSTWADEAGRVDVVGFARHTRRPIVHDREHGLWAFGEPVEQRALAMDSVLAPDFTLSDLEGIEHSLSDYRGRKIFLLTWGSY